MFYIPCGRFALANWGWMEGYESKSYDRIGVRDGWMDDCCRANLLISSGLVYSMDVFRIQDTLISYFGMYKNTVLPY